MRPSSVDSSKKGAVDECSGRQWKEERTREGICSEIESMSTEKL